MGKIIYRKKSLRMNRWRSSKEDNIMKAKRANIIANLPWVLALGQVPCTHFTNVTLWSSSMTLVLLLFSSGRIAIFKYSKICPKLMAKASSQN